MSFRDTLEAANARIEALEADLAELRRGGGSEQQALLKARQSEVEAKAAQAMAELSLANEKARAEAELTSLRYQLESSQRVAEASQQAADRLQRALDGARQSNADAPAEPGLQALEHEIEALRSFDPIRGLGFYQDRVAQCEGQLSSLIAQRRATEAARRQLPEELDDLMRSAKDDDQMMGLAEKRAMRDVFDLRLEQVSAKIAAVEKQRNETLQFVGAAAAAFVAAGAAELRDRLAIAVRGCPTCEAFVTSIPEERLARFGVGGPSEVLLDLNLEGMIKEHFAASAQDLTVTCRSCERTGFSFPRWGRDNAPEFDHVKMELAGDLALART